MIWKYLFSGLVLLLHLQYLDATLFPIGDELVYDYESRSTVETKIPYEYESTNYIRAKLHVVGIKENIVAFALTQIFYQLHNGPTKVVNEKFTPIDSSILRLTFLVEYIPDLNETFRIKRLIMHPDDEEWSRNIKKAIVSNFQLDLKLNPGIEPSIYGDINTKYLEDGNSFTKLRGDNGLSKYIVNETIQRIETHSDFEHSLGNQMVSVSVEQVFNLTKIHSSSEWTAVILDDILTYTPASLKILKPSHRNLGFDLTKIDELLEQVENQIKSQINFTKNDFKNIDAGQEVMFKLMNLNLIELEKLFESIQNRNIFVEMLAFVGTEASVEFLSQLISDGKIKNLIPRVIGNLFSEVKKPSGKIFKILEENTKLALKELAETNFGVYTSAVFALAELIGRTRNSPKFKLYRDFFYLNYLEFKNHTTIDDHQIFLLQCLSSIDPETLPPMLLEPNTVFQHYVINSLPDDSTNHLWLILSNGTTENNHLRITALKKLFSNFDHFNEVLLHDLLVKETNEWFYSFTYDSLKSYSKATSFDPKRVKIAKLSEKLLRKLRQPIIEVDGIQVSEYLDQSDSNGFRLEYFYQPTSNGVIFNGDVLTKFYGVVRENISADVRLEDGRIRIVLKRDGKTRHFVSLSKIDDFQSLPKLLQSFGIAMKAINNLHFELILAPGFVENDIRNDLASIIQIYEQNSIILSVNSTANFKSGFNFKLNLKRASTRENGIRVYEPINNLWHGVRQLDSSFTNIPLNIELEKSETKFNLVLREPEKGVLGTQRYVELQVVLQNLNDKVKKHLKRKSEGDILTESIKGVILPTENVELLNQRTNEIGHVFQMKLFDCDQDISFDRLDKEINFSEYFSQNFELAFLHLLNPKWYLLLDGFSGNCGMGSRIVPAVTNISYSRFSFEIEKGEKLENNLYNNTFKALVEIVNNESKIISGHNGTFYAAVGDNFNPFRDDFKLQGEVPIIWAVYPDRKNRTDVMYIRLNFTHEPEAEYMVTGFLSTEPDLTKYNGYEFKIRAMRSYEQSGNAIFVKQCRTSMYRNYTSPPTKECLLAATSLREIDFTTKEQHPRSDGSLTNGDVRTSYFSYPMLHESEIDYHREYSREVIWKNGLSTLGKKFYLPLVNQFYGIFGGWWSDGREHTCVYTPDYKMDLDNQIRTHRVWNRHQLFFNHTDQNNSVVVYSRIDESNFLNMRLELKGNVFICAFDPDRKAKIICTWTYRNEDVDFKSTTDKYRKKTIDGFDFLITDNPPLALFYTNHTTIVFGHDFVRIETTPEVLEFMTTPHSVFVEPLCLGAKDMGKSETAGWW